MRYAKITNNKVVAIQESKINDSWVEVISDWVSPVEYPDSFYLTSSESPRFKIEGDSVRDTLSFDLKSVISIKGELYQAQKAKRQLMQLGSFTVGGLTVTLKDREDSLIISSLAEEETSYKVDQGEWVTLSGVEVAAMKVAHRAHVQAAYDWEMSTNGNVAIINTHEELKAYIQGDL